MYSDSHLHTSFSGDSDTPPEQQIERAVSLGMEHLTITDHHDMDFPPSFCSFELDLDHYIPEMQRLRETCRGRIDLGIGIELGLQPQLTRELPSCTSSWPFDFVIGSQHLVRRIDPYEMDQAIEALGTWDNVCRTYLEEELANLKQFDCWDIAGHLDYVVRYGRDRAGEYTWENTVTFWMKYSAPSLKRGRESNTTRPVSKPVSAGAIPCLTHGRGTGSSAVKFSPSAQTRMFRSTSATISRKPEIF